MQSFYKVIHLKHIILSLVWLPECCSFTANRCGVIFFSFSIIQVHNLLFKMILPCTCQEHKNVSLITETFILRVQLS